jgi:hypothetical protein
MAVSHFRRKTGFRVYTGGEAKLTGCDGNSPGKVKERGKGQGGGIEKGL